MPYITKIRREELQYGSSAKTAGELNYLLTEIVRNYFDDNGGKYQQINDVVGALEGCKLEFTRRVTNDYEDSKIKENGDVYGIHNEGK